MIRKFLQWLGWRKRRRENVLVTLTGALPASPEIEVYEVGTGRVVSRTPLAMKPGAFTTVDIPPGCWFCYRHHLASGPATSTLTAGLQ